MRLQDFPFVVLGRLQHTKSVRRRVVTLLEFAYKNLVFVNSLLNFNFKLSHLLHIAFFLGLSNFSFFLLWLLFFRLLRLCWRLKHDFSFILSRRFCNFLYLFLCGFLSDRFLLLGVLLAS